MGQSARTCRSVPLSASPLATAGGRPECVMMFAPASDAEALKLLRAGFRDSPLGLRVAALDFLMRRGRRRSAPDYSPR